MEFNVLPALEVLDQEPDFRGCRGLCSLADAEVTIFSWMFRLKFSHGCRG